MSRWGLYDTGEREILELLKDYARRKGYVTLYEGKREGPDLVLFNKEANEIIVVEIRGIPTMFKVKGKDKGKKKDKSVIENQFWGWLGEVIIELMDREYE